MKRKHREARWFAQGHKALIEIRIQIEVSGSRVCDPSPSVSCLTPHSCLNNSPLIPLSLQSSHQKSILKYTSDHTTYSLPRLLNWSIPIILEAK